MTNSNVREIFIDLAKSEHSETYIAKILACFYPNINFGDKKILFESLMHYYRIALGENSPKFDDLLPKEENIGVASDIYGKDYRIKNFVIADVRGIPGKDDQGIPFGVDLVENSVINNAIILANNGTGKSSVFSALEMLFTQEISEKKLRKRNVSSLGLQEYSDYLKRLPYERQPLCVIDTPSGKFDLVNVVFTEEQIKVINPSNHFISDFNIYDHGQRDFDGHADNINSFHSLIAESLGLGDFIAKQSVLKETQTYRRATETGNLKKLEKQMQDAVRSEKDYNEQIDAKNIELTVLKESGENTEQNPIENKKKRLESLLQKPIYYSLNDSEFRDSLESYTLSYLKSQSVQSNQKEILSKNFLATGLQLLDEFDDCPFCRSSKVTKEEIKKNVELRVAELQRSQELDEVLKQEYKTVADILGSFYRQSQTLYEQINIERTEIASHEELSSVFEKEESLYIDLSLRLNDDELIKHIDTLRSKQIPDQHDIEALFNLISQDIIKSNASVISKINLFLKERKEAIAQTIHQLVDNKQELTIAQRKALLDAEMTRLKEQFESTKKYITELSAQIETLQKEVALIGRIKSELEGFIPLFDSEVNELINKAFEPIQEIVETILKDYLKDEDIKLTITKQEKKVIIDEQEVINSIIVANLECVNKQTGEIHVLTPDMYFNTFRYKLFCLMVSLSLALATRKEHKVNLPLVIDDIFFASDFISKNSFAEFLQKVIRLFYKQTPEMPLQIILFTHDDLIFRSAIDAVESFNIESEEEEICDENRQPLIEKTMIGRFFNPIDKDPHPSVLPNNDRYWNLLYCVPKTVNQLINVE